jgi:ABC-2 type transport system ATP-binding protein
MNQPPIVQFAEAVKDYPRGFLGLDRLRAVDHVSFDLQAGEVFALLGPNRAGKTTLVKLLLGLCQPTQGKVLRFGQPSSDLRTLTRLGYVHENQAFPRYLTARALLEYYGAMSLLTEEIVQQRVPKLLERVGLADRSDEAISRFSKGMVQRLGLAQALLNEPELLVFDEPSEGLDLLGRQLVRDIVVEQKKQGRSVLIVSHLLPEIESICDRVGVVAGGKLRFLGSVDELVIDKTTGERRPIESALKDLYVLQQPLA